MKSYRHRLLSVQLPILRVIESFWEQLWKCKVRNLELISTLRTKSRGVDGHKQVIQRWGKKSFTRTKIILYKGKLESGQWIFGSPKCPFNAEIPCNRRVGGEVEQVVRILTNASHLWIVWKIYLFEKSGYRIFGWFFFWDVHEFECDTQCAETIVEVAQIFIWF